MCVCARPSLECMRQVISGLYRQHTLGGCVNEWSVDDLEQDLGLFMIGVGLREPW